MLGNVSERAETQGGPGEVKRQGHAIVCDQGEISDVSQSLRSWRGGKAIDRRVALHTVRHRQAWTPRPTGMKRSCRRELSTSCFQVPQLLRRTLAAVCAKWSEAKYRVSIHPVGGFF